MWTHRLANLTALTELSLYSNKLSGSIPATISDMPKLQTLKLSDNVGLSALDPQDQKPPALKACWLTGCDLDCPIPDWATEVSTIRLKLIGQIDPHLGLF